MKTGIKFIIGGVGFLVFAFVLGLIQNKFSTYSLFYFVGGYLIGCGITSLVDDNIYGRCRR